MLSVPNLEYSAGALDALGLFYRKKFIVFAEGPDDVPFWDKILKELGLVSVHFKPAGGSEELKKYLRDLIEGGSDIVIASDSHYSEVLESQVDHPRILYTYGHSIENSLYSARAISAVIAAFLRVTNCYQAEVRSWKATFASRVEPLLVFEIANQKFQRGAPVSGSSCHRLLPNARATLPCHNKVRAECSSLQREFTSEEIEVARAAVKKISKDSFWLIRGHFVTQGVLNFVKSMVEKEGKKYPALSNDALYVMAFGALSLQAMESDDRRHLVRQVGRLVESTTG